MNRPYLASIIKTALILCRKMSHAGTSIRTSIPPRSWGMINVVESNLSLIAAHLTLTVVANSYAYSELEVFYVWNAYAGKTAFSLTELSDGHFSPVVPFHEALQLHRIAKAIQGIIPPS